MALYAPHTYSEQMNLIWPVFQHLYTIGTRAPLGAVITRARAWCLAAWIAQQRRCCTTFPNVGSMPSLEGWVQEERTLPPYCPLVQNKMGPFDEILRLWNVG